MTTDVPTRNPGQTHSADAKTPEFGDLPARTAGLKRLIAVATAQLRSARGTEMALSWLRLALFGLAVAVFFFLDTQGYLPYAIAVALLLPFFFVVARHGAVKRKRMVAEQKLQACRDSEQRLGGHVVCINHWQAPDQPGMNQAVDPFFDDGKTWTISPQEIQDLDIHTGPVGLFGMLDRSSTIYGRRRLQAYLTDQLLQPDAIVQRQRAVRKLAGEPDRRIHIMGSMAAARRQDKAFNRLCAALRESRSVLSDGQSLALRCWGCLSAAGGILMLVFIGMGQYGWGYALLLLIAVNAAILRHLHATLQSEIKRWKNTGAAVRILQDAVSAGSDAMPEEASLDQLASAIRKVNERKTLPALSRAVAWTESGGIFHVISNLLFLFDLHIIHAVHKKAIGQRTVLLHAMSAVAELDALCSLACFAWEQPAATFPMPVTHHALTIRDGVHPLIKPEQAVANDVHLDANTRIWIVTGSNMAGKSTLLRMTAVNVLLAQIGSAVNAGHMTWSPVRLITDLQAHDSLADGESYFLAEVRHLKRLVVAPDGTEPIFGIVDEPLRGTNSPEQTAAGIALVDHLRQSGYFFMIATHEHEITKLSDADVVRNFHFVEHLNEDGMVFDYKLREGPATTRNAIRVLEREGFPAHLISRARNWLAERHGDL